MTKYDDLQIKLLKMCNDKDEMVEIRDRMERDIASLTFEIRKLKWELARMYSHGER